MNDKSKKRDKLHTSTRTHARKELMLHALCKCGGVISDAAKAAGISRRMHYNWYKDDEQYREQVDDIQEEQLDSMEGKLTELVEGVYVIDHKHGQEYYLCSEDEEGNLIPISDKPVKVSQRSPCYKSIALMLKCQGKHRGWTERQEITGGIETRTIFVEIE